MAANCRVLVLISGNGSNLQAIIDNCDANTQIVGVISNQPDAYGLVRAHRHEIDTSCVIARQSETREEYDQRLQAAIEKYQPDLIVLAGFMRILSDNLVNHYQGRMINIHPSLLPKYTGLNTHRRAIEAGDQEHGTSVHFVIPKLDAGPIILQAKVPIYPNDTIADLTARIQEQEHAIYPLVIKWFIQRRLTMKDGNAWLDGKIIGSSGYAPD